MKALLVVGMALAVSPAFARDDGQWANQPPEIQEWFRSVMQPGWEGTNSQGRSCCGEADAFDVALAGDGPGGAIMVKILNGKGLIPDGTLVIVPHDKLQPKYGNPLDSYILFIGSGGQIYCLIPKSGV